VQTTFQVPPWHSVLLASRLITMLKTDLETGLVERTVSALQWRHEAIMERQALRRWLSGNAVSPATCTVAPPPPPAVLIVVCGCFALFLRCHVLGASSAAVCVSHAPLPSSIVTNLTAPFLSRACVRVVVQGGPCFACP
jgi:hypothetical protein